MRYDSELGSQSSSCPHCWSLLGPWLCKLSPPTPGLMAFECQQDWLLCYWLCQLHNPPCSHQYMIHTTRQTIFLNFTTSLKTGDWYLHLQPHPLSWPRKHKNCWRVARYHRQVISNPPKWKMCTYFRFSGLSRELPMGTRHWKKSQRLSEEDDWQNVEHSG